MSFYYRYKSLPAPKTFDKFISIGQIPTISVHPNMLGKINTALQMVYIGSLVYRPLVESVVSGAVYDGLGLVVGRPHWRVGPTTCLAKVHGDM